MVITAAQMIREITKTLADAGVFEPRFEAQETVREYFGKDPLIYGYEELSAEAAEKIKSAVSQRITGRPLQYILGHWDFYGRDFTVGEGVLIPRPETELLVEAVLPYCKKGADVIDLCSGSGCIPISINLESGADCTAIELYDEAFGYLTKNIAKFSAGVEAVKGDVLSDILPNRMFDVITSNPPYLTGKEMDELQKEVSFEPQTALFGGEDGLDFYKRLIPLWKNHLKSGGVFAVEIGETQGISVKRIMAESGLNAEIIKDYAGNDRVVIGKL